VKSSPCLDEQFPVASSPKSPKFKQWGEFEMGSLNKGDAGKRTFEIIILSFLVFSLGAPPGCGLPFCPNTGEF